MISEASLLQAQTEYLVTMTSENRVVRDNTITPFFMAMKIEDFQSVTDKGCLILRWCPTCKGSYSAKHTIDDSTYWGCPHCHDVAADN